MRNQTFQKGDKQLSYDDSFFTQYNVPIPENNLLHGDVVHKKHGIWKSLEAEEEQAEKELEIARKHGKSSEITSICKKCNKVGHYAFECMNNVKLSDKQAELNTLIPSSDDEEEKLRKKKEKKEKKREKKEEKRKRKEEKKMDEKYSRSERDEHYKSRKYSNFDKESSSDRRKDYEGTSRRERSPSKYERDDDRRRGYSRDDRDYRK